MKKFLFAIPILTVYMSLGSFSVIAANNIPQTIESSENIILKTDGTEGENIVKWNAEHNRLLIDSDFIGKHFGAEIKTANNSIDIYKNEHILHFETDNEFYVMDNLGGRKIDCLAEIDNDKVYLPLRYICEAFGASIEYDNLKQTVNIVTNTIIMEDSIKPYFKNVQVFDQSTIRITGEKTIYIDPRRILGEPHDADIIFITHTHNDHYEIESIKRVMKDSTLIYITEDGVEQAKKDGLVNVSGIVPNADYKSGDINFSTVSAYNTSSERQNHKKEFNWVGYIININGYSYYSAGDSDFTEEMTKILKPIDVVFLPIDGKYNMDSYEAAKAANAIMPKVAVPYHYNNFVPEDKAIQFTELLNNDIKSAIVTFKMQ